jgi:hypothetical protein
MQSKYNAVMSGTPPDVATSLQGNRYTTTIHLLLSALDKLRQTARPPRQQPSLFPRVPHRNHVYIGVPREASHALVNGASSASSISQMWKKDRHGRRGGLVRGIVAASRDPSVVEQGEEACAGRLVLVELALTTTCAAVDLAWVSLPVASSTLYIYICMLCVCVCVCVCICVCVCCVYIHTHKHKHTH